MRKNNYNLIEEFLKEMQSVYEFHPEAFNEKYVSNKIMEYGIKPYDIPGGFIREIDDEMLQSIFTRFNVHNKESLYEEKNIFIGKNNNIPDGFESYTLHLDSLYLVLGLTSLNKFFNNNESFSNCLIKVDNQFNNANISVIIPSDNKNNLLLLEEYVNKRDFLLSPNLFFENENGLLKNVNEIDSVSNLIYNFIKDYDKEEKLIDSFIKIWEKDNKSFLKQFNEKDKLIYDVLKNTYEKNGYDAMKGGVELFLQSPEDYKIKTLWISNNADDGALRDEFNKNISQRYFVSFIEKTLRMADYKNCDIKNIFTLEQEKTFFDFYGFIDSKTIEKANKLDEFCLQYIKEKRPVLLEEALNSYFEWEDQYFDNIPINDLTSNYYSRNKELTKLIKTSLTQKNENIYYDNREDLVKAYSNKMYDISIEKSKTI